MNELGKKQLTALKEIIYKEYGFTLSDQDAKKLGLSLLRLTRVASVAFLRSEKNQPKIHE